MAMNHRSTSFRPNKHNQQYEPEWGYKSRLNACWRSLKRHHGDNVCEEWYGCYASFMEWAKARGYRKGLTLWRHDTDGSYSPANCFLAEGRQVVLHIQHGGCGTRLYHTWKGMRKRCNNPGGESYRHYGGRGINVCPEWDDFGAFRDWATSHGYADDLTLERDDTDKDYCPENCRWIPNTEQPRNRRGLVPVTAFGETRLAIDWANDPMCQVKYGGMLRRLRDGWTPEEAITVPSWQKPSRFTESIAAFRTCDPQPSTPDEEWCPVVGYEGLYDVSDCGRVRSYYLRRGTGQLTDTPHLLKIGIDEHGRPKVYLHKNMKSRTLFVSALVMEAFVGPRPDGMHVCHFPDPNPANCHLSNLRWDTQSENQLDIKRVRRLAVKQSEEQP